MTGKVVDIEDYRPVWCVMRVECRACGLVAVSVVHARAPMDKLECHACGACDSKADLVEDLELGP